MKNLQPMIVEALESDPENPKKCLEAAETFFHLYDSDMEFAFRWMAKHNKRPGHKHRWIWCRAGRQEESMRFLLSIGEAPYASHAYIPDSLFMEMTQKVYKAGEIEPGLFARNAPEEIVAELAGALRRLRTLVDLEQHTTKEPNNQ